MRSGVGFTPQFDSVQQLEKVPVNGTVGYVCREITKTFKSQVKSAGLKKKRKALGHSQIQPPGANAPVNLTHDKPPGTRFDIKLIY